MQDIIEEIFFALWYEFTGDLAPEQNPNLFHIKAN